MEYAICLSLAQPSQGEEGEHLCGPGSDENLLLSDIRLANLDEFIYALFSVRCGLVVRRRSTDVP